MTNHIDISFSLINDMLGIACLIYDCNKELQFKKNNNYYDIKSLDISSINISTLRKEILVNLLKQHESYELVKFIDNHGVQAGITLNHKEKRINVVFRGSDELIDWLYNFFICKTKINENMYVHGGFYRLLYKNNLYHQLFVSIESLLTTYKNYNLNITGHSLGAALATLFGYFLSYDIPNKINIISFASPRVGNKTWVSTFNKKENINHYRIVNQKDIVTAIPYFDYCHCGNYINVSNNNLLDYVNMISYEDNNSIINYYNISDHSIENYYINFNKCINNNEKNCIKYL
tara:strand:+ start:23795 stop:24664 length:870 start_codon:yes stop_codon:yes gene_type:complete